MTHEPIELDQLADQARSSTGLDDLGEGSWREGAERLVEALNTEAALHELGNVIASSEIADYLTNRLRVVDWTKRNPEIAQKEIRPPIVILGLPRTGTTILFGVLAQDPDNRVPLTWEVDQPWPPPQTATYESDPRIAEVQAKLEGTEFLIPGFLGMHELGSLLGQECVRITAGDFRSMIFPTQYRIPTYQHWLLHEADMASAYRYHRLYLQYLQSAHPAERWVVKSPAHLWSPWSMMNEYPDALVIQTHRDPVRVLCSLASLTDLLRRLASSEVSLDAVARGWVEDVAIGLDRVVMARREGTIPQSQAVDVLFGAFLANPMNVVSEIYERLGIELTKAAEQAMRNFLAEHPQEKYGGHRYTFDDTGLDAGDLRERMRPYQEYFDIPNEALP
jgi:hypothetical protein